MSSPASDKTLSMISALLDRKIDAASRLDSFAIDVRLADDPPSNAADACLVALNLLPRFLKYVKYEGSEKVPASMNPMHTERIGYGSNRNTSMVLVFGKEIVPTDAETLYVDSSGWSSYLSTTRPCDWNPSVRNRLGALYAGSLAVGEVFKAALPEAAPKKIRHLEYDLVTHGRARQPVTRPAMPPILDLDDFMIVGCGAVGQAMCFALRDTLPLAGNVMLVDHDALDESNEQRYPLAFGDARGINKAHYLGVFLEHGNPLLTAGIVTHKYEIHMAVNSCAGTNVVTCVDNVWTRINVQGSIPRIIWNGWTDVSPNKLRYGISRHMLGNDNACIACYYYPDGPAPSELEMNSIRTGLPQEEIKHLLDTGATCTPELARRVSGNTGIPLQILEGAVGKPFHALLHGNCGVFNQRVHGVGAATPAPHQPMLVGVVLAAQLILAQSDPAAVPIESLSEFDALQIPNHSCVFRSKKHPRCFCNEPEYQEAYHAKWGDRMPNARNVPT